MRPSFALAMMVMIAAGSAAMAQQRQLQAHEHGVGQLNIAFQDGSVVMELEAPGADIVGFEHPADTARDRAAIKEAAAMLAKPQSLFDFPEEAGCEVTHANVELEGDEHSTDEHHDEAAHEGEAHSDHKDESGKHTEFHAQYELTCDAPAKITVIRFPYFEIFPNARELEVQLITGKGANRFEVESNDPRIDMSGML